MPMRRNVLLLTIACAGAALAELPPLIPLPREVELDGGTLALVRPVSVNAPEGEVSSAVRVLEDTLGPLGDGGTAISLELTEDGQLGPEGYELRVSGDGVTIAAPTPTGLFYGAHTLRQLAEGAGDELPTCRIRDWPAMRWRGMDYPLTRAEDLRRLAGLKQNLVVWEVSGLFASPSHPELGGRISLEELAAICAEARRNHITLILHIQSFGHAHWLLTPRPELRADPDSTHTINPDAPGVYGILSDLYAELIAASGVPWFFPGCDEPWQIDAWCEANGLDPAQVVGEHIARLAEIAAANGARIMVWGDYLLKYPASLGYFSPDDVVICDWHYEPAETYPSVDTFVQAGFETLVAPSTCPWEPLFPAYERSAENIRTFVADGHRRGAIGMLNTNWPTGPMPTAALWYGWALAGEASWREDPVEADAYDGRFFAQHFGADAAQAAALYFDWAGANSAWRMRPAPDAVEFLSTLAVREVVGTPPPPWRGQRVRDLVARTEALCDAAADPRLRGWADLRAIAEGIQDALYPYLRNDLLRHAFIELLDARAAADEGDTQEADRALQAARSALEEALAFIHDDDPEALSMVTQAFERLPKSPAEGPWDPLTVFSIQVREAGAAPSEIDVVASYQVLDPAKQPPAPHGASGIIIPQRDTPVEIHFRVQQSGHFWVWALLRHSAGIWEEGSFVRGGRNAVYEGRYNLQLNGEPLGETWIGEELNPDDDEALQWAVIYEGPLERGPHALSVRPEVTNFAIVERLVFTSDAQWSPGQ